MSRITLSGNASGTGNFTLASPNSNTDRTLTLPDATGTVLTDQSTVSATQIAGALNASGSAPIFACRAWVYFDGATVGTPILASGNVTSVTDHAVGDFTVNLTTAMSDTNYAVLVSASATSAGVSAGLNDGRTKTTSAAPIQAISDAGNKVDRLMSVAIFR
jgi:hypothetical protein